MDYNPIGEEYGMVGAPQTLAALLSMMPVPKCEDDKSRPGMVILDTAWVQEHIVFVPIPLLGQRHVHKVMAGPLYAAMAEIAAGPCADVIKPRQCGVFVPRKIGWTAKNPLSLHALALAVDINWEENPYGVVTTKIREEYFWVVKIMEKHGFYWGGRWKTADDMHFQYAHPSIVIPR